MERVRGSRYAAGGAGNPACVGRRPERFVTGLERRARSGNGKSKTGGAMQEKHGSDVSGSGQFGGEGDWSYLRAHLDNPRHRLAKRLGGGLAAWIWNNWQTSLARPARLALIARIPLGPRQAVALIEAEGMHLLVATSTDGAASFFPLDPATPPRSVESSVEPVRSASIPEPPFPWSRDRQLLPGPSLGSRPGRRSGLPGRVSW